MAPLILVMFGVRHPRPHGAHQGARADLARVHRLRAASLLLALVTAACGDGVTTPTPNDGGGPPPPPPAVQTFHVSGTISEATDSGSVPLEGAWVVNFATEESTITDANGAYTLSNQRAGAAQFSVSKDGYENQMIDVMIDGDMQLDAVLVRAPSESN
jgi:hypothetical protein